MRWPAPIALLAALSLGACQGAGQPESAAAPQPASQPAPRLPVDDDVTRMIGAEPAALLAELGEPQLTRRESPAEIWQYRGAGCVLDFFLYDNGGPEIEVIHLEARGATAEKTDPRPCFAGLLRRHRAAQG